MYHFEYLPKKKRSEAKRPIIELISQVQDDLRDMFTFKYAFSGSDRLNMITYDPRTNTGYDFDINIEVNDPDGRYTAKELKQALMASFDKFLPQYGFDYCEDSTRVFTFKKKDRRRSSIIYSCDVAIVNDYDDEDGYRHQEIVYFNKSQNSYGWKEQPSGFYKFWDRVEKLRSAGYWGEIRDLYLLKKNSNDNPEKKSRSLRAEAVNEVYMRYFGNE